MQFIAIDQHATGVIAIGQHATGVIAIGQEALGIIAIGQMARGVFAIGQLSISVFGIGMLSLSLWWSLGMLGAGGQGAGLLYLRLLPPTKPKTARGTPIPQNAAQWFAKLRLHQLLFWAIAWLLFFQFVALPLLANLGASSPPLEQIRIEPDLHPVFVYGLPLLIALLIPALIRALALAKRERERREQALKERGRFTDAIITRVKGTGVRINKKPQIKVFFECTLSDGRACELVQTTVVSDLEEPSIQAGQVYPFRYVPDEAAINELKLAGQSLRDLPIEVLREGAPERPKAELGPLGFLPEARPTAAQFAAVDPESQTRIPVQLDEQGLRLEPPGGASVAIHFEEPFTVALGYSHRAGQDLLHLDIQQRRFGISTRFGLSSGSRSFPSAVTDLQAMSPSFPFIDEANMLSLLGALRYAMLCSGKEHWGR
jgi:hypothetical protein